MHCQVSKELRRAQERLTKSWNEASFLCQLSGALAPALRDYMGSSKERDGMYMGVYRDFASALPLFLFAGWVGCELLLLLTIRRSRGLGRMRPNRDFLRQAKTGPLSGRLGCYSKQS